MNEEFENKQQNGDEEEVQNTVLDTPEENTEESATTEVIADSVDELAQDTVADEAMENADVIADDVNTNEPIAFDPETGEPIIAQSTGDWGSATMSEPAKKSKAVVIAIIAAIVIAVAAIGIGGYIFMEQSLGINYLSFNKYNRQYVDVTGRTIEEIATAQNQTVAEFLEEYSLPADMPKNTNENAAYYTIPAKNIAKMYGMDFATMKTMLSLGDDVTEDTPWGQIEGEMTVGDQIGGEENLASFKEKMGLDDKVTIDTKWKEIRMTIDRKSRQDRIKSEKEPKQDAPAIDGGAAPQTDVEPATDPNANVAPATDPNTQTPAQ